MPIVEHLFSPFPWLFEFLSWFLFCYLFIFFFVLSCHQMFILIFFSTSVFCWVRDSGLCTDRGNGNHAGALLIIFISFLTCLFFFPLYFSCFMLQSQSKWMLELWMQGLSWWSLFSPPCSWKTWYLERWSQSLFKSKYWLYRGNTWGCYWGNDFSQICNQVLGPFGILVVKVKIIAFQKCFLLGVKVWCWSMNFVSHCVHHLTMFFISALSMMNYLGFICVSSYL